jgi:SAM-dependent methyltransferase
VSSGTVAAPEIPETKAKSSDLTEGASEEVAIPEVGVEINLPFTDKDALGEKTVEGTAITPALVEPLIDVDVSVETTAEEEEAERTIRDEDLEPLPSSLYSELIESRTSKGERGSGTARENAASGSEAESDEKVRPQSSPLLDAKPLILERPSVPTPIPPIRSTPIPPPPQSSQTGARSTAATGPIKRPSNRPVPTATGPLQVPSPPAKSARTSPGASSNIAPSAGTAKVQPPDATKRQTKSIRPWWERFFTDDYLRSVVLPSPQQVKRQCDFIESSLALAHGSTILDVGCGKGVHAIDLTTRGYLVVGLDLSLPMITRAAEEAQYRNLKINFLHADIREIAFDGAFDAVICMGTTFGFFDDEANRDVLARLYGALRPGGRLLLDVVNRDFVMGSQPNLVWFQGDGCVCMEESDFSYFTSRLQVKRTMMHEDGRQTEAEYSVRLYSLHELGWLLRQMGFRVLEVSGQEATRGMFFGLHAPRLVMLAERQVVTGENRNQEPLL